MNLPGPRNFFLLPIPHTSTYLAVFVHLNNATDLTTLANTQKKLIFYLRGCRIIIERVYLNSINHIKRNRNFNLQNQKIFLIHENWCDICVFLLQKNITFTMLTDGNKHDLYQKQGLSHNQLGIVLSCSTKWWKIIFFTCNIIRFRVHILTIVFFYATNIILFTIWLTLF